MDESEYGEYTYGPLKPGQVIVVGTDGVWEMPNAAGEFFGKSRLREVIRARPRGRPGRSPRRSSTASPRSGATAVRPMT